MTYIAQTNEIPWICPEFYVSHIIKWNVDTTLQDSMNNISDNRVFLLERITDKQADTFINDIILYHYHGNNQWPEKGKSD